MVKLLRSALLAGMLCVPQASPLAADEPQKSPALAAFERRVLPILQSKSSSSCAECHLGGVDLADYLDPSQEKTFANLLRAGLIDTRRPAESKLLKFIARKSAKPSLVNQQAREAELAALTEWIELAVKEPALLAAKAKGAAPGPSVPLAVVRHARRDRVLASFIDNFWSEVGRCAACHSPDRNQEQVKKHGESVSWITLNDPQATLDYLLEAELIDVEKPAKSMILQKPTEQVKHGGGQKLMIGDRTYRQFLRFLDDYAATAAGKYRQAEQLPQPAEEASQVSDVWLKLTGVPPRFDKKLLRVDVYSRDVSARSGWAKPRVATGDRAVFGQGQLWQQHLTIVAVPGTPRAAEIRKQPSLPPGKYLLKVYVDAKDKLRGSEQAELGGDDLVGQVHIESEWPAGYGRMTIAEFPAAQGDRP